MRSTLEAVKLLKDWSVWLVGIQTGAIAAIAALLKATQANDWTVYFGTGAVISFVVSIIFATYLLVSLPAFYLRHPEIEDKEDFVNKPAFVGRLPEQLRSPKLLILIGGQQHAFLLGIVFFAAFVIARLRA